MKLWTYHPATLKVDDRNSPGIDPALGTYWRSASLQYEESLKKLCDLIGVAKYPLWCYTTRRPCPLVSDPTVVTMEWALEGPESAVLAYIRAPVWDAIVRGKSAEWGEVMIAERPVPPAMPSRPSLISHWRTNGRQRALDGRLTEFRENMPRV
jgi:hypothetical protein